MEIKKKVPVHEKVLRIFIAVGIAVLLWFMVNGNSDMIVNQDFNSIPITLTNVDGLSAKKLVLAEDKSYYLNLRVKGTDKNLRKINTKEITAEVNLGDINTKGTYDLEIVVKGLSNSVIIDSMNPTALQIVVDNIIKENLEVGIVLEGRPANDAVVISAKSLEKVEVQGPEESIARIKTTSGTANVNDLAADTIEHIQIMAYDESGNRINDVVFLPSVITAEIILGQTKSVGVISTTSGQPADGYVVSEVLVEPSNVLIGAKQELVDQIQSITMNAIDVSGQAKTFTKDVSLTPPKDCYFLDGNDKVKVTVNIESVVERSFSLDKISVQNLGAGLVVSKMKESKVLLKLEGAGSALNTLNTAQSEAFVDCANLGPGEYELPIQTNLSSGLVKSITPAKTTVTIE
ncbi:MAG: YbbR-like domain-containing protein [Acetobacterium sp.]